MKRERFGFQDEMEIKTGDALQAMREAGRILGIVLHELKDRIAIGVSERDLDRYAENRIKELGGEPAFLGYAPEGAHRPFPATLCTSVNDIVVHGVPTDRALKNGDIISLDLGVKFHGYYADAAITVPVGSISEKALQLITVTNECLAEGIRSATPGNTIGDIGYAIQERAKRAGCGIIRGLTGHGIGRALHEDPPVPNEGVRGRGMKLREGMTIAIEPMLVLGKPDVFQNRDDGYLTADGSLSAHAEHTILIRRGLPEILTLF